MYVCMYICRSGLGWAVVARWYVCQTWALISMTYMLLYTLILKYKKPHVYLMLLNYTLFPLDTKTRDTGCGCTGNLWCITETSSQQPGVPTISPKTPSPLCDRWESEDHSNWQKEGGLLWHPTYSWWEEEFVPIVLGFYLQGLMPVAKGKVTLGSSCGGVACEKLVRERSISRAFLFLLRDDGKGHSTDDNWTFRVSGLSRCLKWVVVQKRRMCQR